jgi:hypothetical protein
MEAYNLRPLCIERCVLVQGYVSDTLHIIRIVSSYGYEFCKANAEYYI